MTSKPHRSEEHLEGAIERRRARRDLWGREGERSLAENLAMVGSLGWLIVVPALAGVFAGRWLDHRAGTRLTFSAAFLFAGLVTGCWLAWKRIHGA